MNKSRRWPQAILSAWVLGLVLFFAFAPTPQGSGPSSILTSEDLELERDARQLPPALSATKGSPNYWESFDRWMCFPSNQVSVSKVETIYEDRQELIPQLEIWDRNHLIEVSLSAGIDFDYVRIFERWHSMVSSSHNVCVFAAHLQDLEVDGASGSLWIVSRLKTDLSLWNEADEITH